MGEAVQPRVKQADALPHGVRQLARQDLVERGGRHARPVGGLYVPKMRGRAGAQKILHALRRRTIPIAPRAEGCLLKAALPLHAGQRLIAPEIFRPDADQQGGIGVPAVARIAAHAVRHNTAFLTGSGHHLSAGTHAEGVHAPPARQMRGKAVICRAELRVARKPAILRAIHRRLQMLNARTERKRLRFQTDAPLFQHAERIACAVAHRQNEAGTVDRFPVFQHDGGETPVLHAQIGHSRIKPDLTAEGSDLLPDGFHCPGKEIGADVRLCVPQNFPGCSRLSKRSEHKPGARVLCAGVELPVRKCAGAAFPKLHVYARIAQACAPEPLHRCGTFLHGRTAFQHQGPGPGARQNKRGKQAGRPQPGHNGTLDRRSTVRQLIVIRFRFAHLRAEPVQRRAAHLTLHGTDEVHIAAPARIHGTAHQLAGRDPAFRHMQARGRQTAQQPRFRAERERNI